MNERQFERFKDAPWFDPGKEIIMVGGAGGISSWATILLHRAGFYPMVYDFDIVEAHNLGGQLFRESDIGKLKVQALHDIVSTYSGESLSVFDERIIDGTRSHHFVMCGFDNMRARRDMFNNWKRQVPTCPVQPIFIDGRLEFENLQIFCVTPENMYKYEEEYLFEDSEVEDVSCTLRQTSHSAAMIASHMVGFFSNHITNIYERAIVREVPFCYEYFIPMNLTTEIQ